MKGFQGIPMSVLMAEPATTMLLVPKNRGLVAQVTRAVEQLTIDDLAQCRVRGEDIPYLANEFARRGRRVVAITGDDLVDEWLAAGNAFDERVERSRVRWEDPAALYGAPALCLIGGSPFDFAQGDKGATQGDRGPAQRDKGVALGNGVRTPPIRVAVCARYRCLAERFLQGCAADGNVYELVSIQGSLETMLLHGIADLVIDIVVTGKTIAESGLRVLRVISTSDLAVLESQPC
jgi:ATP phosphoribosyltransferase